MSPLCLEDFMWRQHLIVVTPESLGEVTPLLTPASLRPPPAIDGYYSIRTLGLVNRRRSLVAAYTDGVGLKMALLGNVYDLSNLEMQAQARPIAPLVKSLLYYDDDERL
jgi:hypothetical protein